MKKNLLLTILCGACIASAFAQKKAERTTAYAITGFEKGSHRWTEVRLIDVHTGEQINPVYESKSEVKKLNARTGKPIVVDLTEMPSGESVMYKTAPIKIENIKPIKVESKTFENNVVIINGQLSPTKVAGAPRLEALPRTMATTRVYMRSHHVNKELPFATNSAALAYDKKHERLYYTPMGINELRYIDLKAKTPAVYYFQDEAFGTVSGYGDVQNQITRMVIAGDGNGYALTNNADQLIRFTTGKKPEITNLGNVTDDASNGKFSIRSRNAYGGDMVADKSGNLFLITANRRVYKINIKSMVAVYLGSIKGLPEGYTTNGAVVDKGTSIIVTSSSSTQGYYKFDLETLQAEKASQSGSVFNASDLANANLITGNKEKEKPAEEIQEEVLVKEEALQNAVEKSINSDIAAAEPRISVYPNPVTNSVTRVSFADYPAGRYEVQLLDQAGKQLNRQAVMVNAKSQVMEFKLPLQIAKGTYILRVMSESNKAMHVEKIIVQ